MSGAWTPAPPEPGRGAGPMAAATATPRPAKGLESERSDVLQIASAGMQAPPDAPNHGTDTMGLGQVELGSRNSGTGFLASLVPPGPRPWRPDGVSGASSVPCAGSGAGGSGPQRGSARLGDQLPVLRGPGALRSDGSPGLSRHRGHSSGLGAAPVSISRRARNETCAGVELVVFTAVHTFTTMP